MIEPDELLQKRWEKEQFDHITMNVRKVKNMFNTFVDMVQFEILSCPDIDSAVKLIKRLLDIADLCKKEIGNYETPFCINTVLLSEPICILKSVVAKVNASSDHKKIWEELKVTYNPDRRYNQVLIEMEQDSRTVVPCFFALRNVLYYNSDQPSVDKGLINIGKMR